MPGNNGARRWARGLSRVGLITLACMGAAWCAGALWFQVLPPMRWLGLGLGAGVWIALLIRGWRHPAQGWVGLLVLGLTIAVGWGMVRPSNQRDWSADVAHGVTARIDGSQVTLFNVRNFDWRTPEDFIPRWETRHYDLDDIRSVDLITSVWSQPAIAHTLISFGFADGAHLVFSAEIRKERGEAFSQIGGFFKQFELVLIAADEADIVRLRTNIRRESVSIFPVRVTPDQARALFLAYLETADDLAETPRFYNTLTANCTTVIFHLARIVQPDIPMDWRILLSGYLPDYLHDHRALRIDMPMPELRKVAAISARAQDADPAAPYSVVIREGLNMAEAAHPATP